MSLLLPFWMLFLVLAALGVAGAAKYLPIARARIAIGVAVAWLAYAGAVAHAGWLARIDARPPGFLAVGPGIAAIVLFAASSGAARDASRSVPMPVLLGVQTFRLPLELLLYGLHKAALLPEMMTFSGANFDILIGLSAPLVASAAVRGRLPRGALIAWNVAGLAMVANVASRGVLTATGLLAADVPNRAVVMFPYAYIATFFVPTALVLHILSLRKCIGGGHDHRGDGA